MTLELPVSEDSLLVRARGIDLFRCVHRPVTAPFEAPKPYLPAVRTLAADVVTGGRPHIHHWHMGVQVTASWVPGENIWGGGTHLRGQGCVDLPNLRRVCNLTVVSAETGHGRAEASPWSWTPGDWDLMFQRK